MSKAINPLLEISAVHAEIDDASLLKDVSLQVNSGEVLALVGPNGSGKTSLLKSITGELKIQSGDIKFAGQELKQWAPTELAKGLAVLPQKSVLNFPFTGREVVMLGRTPHQSGQKIDNEIVDQVLDYLDAQYLAERLYPRLSGGEQQRIQLARVLAQIWQAEDQEQTNAQPKLLLLDEPSSYFDLAHQQMLVRLVRKIAASNIGVLIILHDINMALSCADRVAVMSCGQIAASGKSQEVITTDLIQQVFSVEASFIQDPQSGQQIISLNNAVEARE